VPLHAADPFAGIGQGVHEPPHVSGSALLTHAPPQRWKPALQAKPQLVPSHVADAFVGGAGHGAHDAPHEATLAFDAHEAPHAWKPVLHAKPQLVASHVALALSGGEQGLHDAPQVMVLAFDAHAAPHAWNPASQLASAQLDITHCAVPFATLHTVLQVPQWLGSVARLASHPSVATPSQLP